MKAKSIEINTFKDLLILIDTYYSTNQKMVIKATETYLKCVYISFGLDTKESFIEKVIKHYDFCKNKPKKDRSIFLTKEPCSLKEFKISQIFN